MFVCIFLLSGILALPCSYTKPQLLSVNSFMLSKPVPPRWLLYYQVWLAAWDVASVPSGSQLLYADCEEILSDLPSSMMVVSFKIQLISQLQLISIKCHQSKGFTLVVYNLKSHTNIPDRVLTSLWIFISQAYHHLHWLKALSSTFPEKGYFAFTSIAVRHPGKSGQEPKGGTLRLWRGAAYNLALVTTMCVMQAWEPKLRSLAFLSWKSVFPNYSKLVSQN